MKRSPSPSRLLTVLILTIFIAESLIMIILRRWFPEAGTGTQIILDSGSLILITFPILYLLFYRPMWLNISERSRAEEALKRHRERLEIEILDRTAVLEETKENLRLRCDDLQKADRIKDTLMYDVAHELKTPVSKHLMSMEMLQTILERHDLPADVTGVLEVMRSSLHRQQKGIQNILMISRFEEEERCSNPGPTRIDQIVNDVLSGYEGAISTCGIRLEKDLSPLTAVGDGELLWHVFANLVDNAIKFRSDVDSWIEVRGIRENGSVEVRIADNGTGIDASEKKHLFNRFYQASASTNGIGAGLALTKMILEKLDGKISIESPGKGKGAVATVTLPAQSASL